MNAGSEHFGEEIRQSGEQKARRLLESELAKLGWREPELQRRPKGDPQKLRMAQRLRKETTMTLEWVAQALNMGTRTHLPICFIGKGRRKSGGDERVNETKNRPFSEGITELFPTAPPAIFPL